MKRAIILDMDNTIFPTPVIGDKLFAPLYELIENDDKYRQVMPQIKKDIVRIPFQKIAETYELDTALKQQAMELLATLSYDEPITPFDDYGYVRKLNVDRFLVTTGFTRMQKSKIAQLGIEGDFKKVVVIDPQFTSKIKKDVFREIMLEFGYEPAEVLVIGDDVHSEIQGAVELGIDTVLYNKQGAPMPAGATYTINNYQQLQELLS